MATFSVRTFSAYHALLFRLGIAQRKWWTHSQSVKNLTRVLESAS